MKIITANIPWIIVGIVRRILKIVKLLLFVSSICHPGPGYWLHLCVQCRKSVWMRSEMDNGDIISTLGDNCLLIGRHLHLSPVSTSSLMSSEMLGSRHSQLLYLERVTTQAVSQLTCFTNTLLMSTSWWWSLRSHQTRASCQMWRYMCYPGWGGQGHVTRVV